MAATLTPTPTSPSLRDTTCLTPESQSESDNHNQLRQIFQSKSATEPRPHVERNRSSAREEKHKHYEEARVTFTKTIAGHYRDGKTGYRRVGALFITWDEDDMQCKETEVDRLRTIFERDFGFETDLYQIPSKKSQSGLMSKVAQFINEYDDPDCLAIIYYAGHGNDGEETKKFKFYARAQATSEGDPSTFFDDIRAVAQTPDCDQLMILDCCFASKAFTREHLGKRKFELLASAAHNQRCDAPRLENSFTRKLNDALPRLLRENPIGFSTAHLFREVYHDVLHVKPSLFDQSPRSLGRIWLRPQISTLPKNNDQGSTYLDITLRLTDTPEGVVMNELASHLQYLPYVREIRVKDLYAPKDKISDFMLFVLQAQKLKPLLRKLLAKRRRKNFLELHRRAKEEHGTAHHKISSHLVDLHLINAERPLYDWSSARRYPKRGWEDDSLEIDQTKRRKSTTWPPESAL